MRRSLPPGLKLGTWLLVFGIFIFWSYSYLLSRRDPVVATQGTYEISQEALDEDYNDLPEPDVIMASIRRSSPLVFPANGRHTATVIFAHGLGDTGKGWASAVENWRRRQRLDEVKFILPHAPPIPITANWGASMPGWFDIKALDGTVEALRANEDEPGVRLTTTYLHELIQSEMDAGIPSDRIVLGGFSQGGAMALFAGLTAAPRLAGVLGMSSWLVLSGRFAEEVKKPGRDANRDTPVWMAHGDSDPIVPVELGRMSADMLKGLGYDVTLKTYRGLTHSADLDELDEIEAWLTKRLPAQGS